MIASSAEYVSLFLSLVSGGYFLLHSLMSFNSFPCLFATLCEEKSALRLFQDLNVNFKSRVSCFCGVSPLLMQ